MVKLSEISISTREGLRFNPSEYEKPYITAEDIGAFGAGGRWVSGTAIEKDDAEQARLIYEGAGPYDLFLRQPAVSTPQAVIDNCRLLALGSKESEDTPITEYRNILKHASYPIGTAKGSQMTIPVGSRIELLDEENCQVFVGRICDMQIILRQ